MALVSAPVLDGWCTRWMCVWNWAPCTPNRGQKSQARLAGGAAGRLMTHGKVDQGEGASSARSRGVTGTEG